MGDDIGRRGPRSPMDSASPLEFLRGYPMISSLDRASSRARADGGGRLAKSGGFVPEGPVKA